MSEYQRYEFMTVDRPLTRAQLDAVNKLSSHIEASATHAVIEYNWGDFKHDPIGVLRAYFDGFLYWANWGSPQLAFRFPHGSLPANLLAGYDLDDFVTITQREDYDILDIQFGEMEAPDEWIDYELSPLIAIREELMEGDLRPLYIVWLAAQFFMEGDEVEEDEEDEVDDEGEEESFTVPPVPPAFGSLTAAQLALAELFRVPQELLGAAARHSSAAAPSTADDFATWVTLLPAGRRNEYLVRLAHNEPGLSRLLVTELRELGLSGTKVTPIMGEHVSYATLITESKGVKAQMAREKKEQERLARERRLQEVHDHQDTYWRQVEKDAARGTAAGYDEATRLLIDLRGAAAQFKETSQFQERFSVWVRSHMRRPALLKRLQARQFTVPQV
jgi:hypothetical protein